jgi:hypothetical protein
MSDHFLAPYLPTSWMIFSSSCGGRMPRGRERPSPAPRGAIRRPGGRGRDPAGCLRAHLLGPLALDQLRVEDLLPSVEALHVGAALEVGGCGGPGHWASDAAGPEQWRGGPGGEGRAAGWHHHRAARNEPAPRPAAPGRRASAFPGEAIAGCALPAARGRARRGRQRVAVGSNEPPHARRVAAGPAAPARPPPRATGPRQCPRARPSPIFFQLRPPWWCTARRRISSSSAVHPPLRVGPPTLPSTGGKSWSASTLLDRPLVEGLRCILSSRHRRASSTSRGGRRRGCAVALRRLRGASVWAEGRERGQQVCG